MPGTPRSRPTVPQPPGAQPSGQFSSAYPPNWQMPTEQRARPRSSRTLLLAVAIAVAIAVFVLVYLLF